MIIDEWWSLLASNIVASEYEDLQNVAREYREIGNGRSTFRCA